VRRIQRILLAGETACTDPVTTRLEIASLLPMT